VAKAKKVKGLNCRAPVAENARKIIAVRLDEMLSFAPYVSDPSNVTELHDLRIAAKRLRYTLELFRFAFPAEIGGLIDEVKEIQEHIGDMHDADVMIERMTEVVETDARQRMHRLLEIASAVDRGSVAQRHQRIRSAMNNRATPRDEIALYTLIAHRADDRDQAYDRFVATWHHMEQSDFPRRLRVCVGLQAPEPPEASAPEPAPEAGGDLEQVAG
jgi:hypothetical protein